MLSRVSTSHQDLTQQTEEILREVHKDGYTDPNIIIIEDVESAINLSEEERRGLNKMKDLINCNSDIACVYLYELSRLSRRQLVLFSIRDFLVERKIQLICLKPYFRLLEVDGTMSQTGSLMFSLFSSLSESEMMLKKERMMRGRRRNRELGKSAGGKPPFGYDLNKEKRYIVNPSESTLIVRIFEDYATRHKSIREIATDLKEEGHFAASSINTLCLRIRTILNNPIYTGEFPYPQILSKDLYSTAQQALALYNETRKGKGKAPFLLKGLTCDARTGYLLITINERDQKRRISIREQQRSMLAMLNREGVDVEKQLSMVDLSSSFFKRNNALATAQYRLLLHDAATVARVWQQLDQLAISQVSIEKMTHSKMAEYRAEVRQAAIRAAKQRATELAEAIDQRVGRCFYIYDMNADGVAMQKSNMLMARGATTDFAEAEEQPSLEFSKIKLSYRVQAKFVLE